MIETHGHLIGTNIVVSCVVDISFEPLAVQLSWIDAEFNSLNTTSWMYYNGSGVDTFPVDHLILSLDLRIKLYNVGVYTCRCMINDTLGDFAVIEKQYYHVLNGYSK